MCMYVVMDLLTEIHYVVHDRGILLPKLFCPTVRKIVLVIEKCYFFEFVLVWVGFFNCPLCWFQISSQDAGDHLNLVMTVVYLMAISLSFLFRGQHLWQRHPGNNTVYLWTILGMAIPVVEVSRKGYKIRFFFWLKINCCQTKF